MAKRRKVRNLLAFAVLGTLSERPMHPYEIATVMKERGKDHSIKINWGSLYTVVTNLERHGLVAATGTTREGQRPERTVYTLTDAGRVEFCDWLRELIGTPETEYQRLTAGLCFLPALPPDEAVALLAARERAVRTAVAQRRDELAALGEKIPRLFLVEEEYALAIRQAEADWLRSLIDEIESGSFPGLAGWRWVHQSGLPLPEAVERLSERGWELD